MGSLRTIEKIQCLLLLWRCSGEIAAVGVRFWIWNACVLAERANTQAMPGADLSLASVEGREGDRGFTVAYEEGGSRQCEDVATHIVRSTIQYIGHRFPSHGGSLTYPYSFGTVIVVILDTLCKILDTTGCVCDREMIQREENVGYL